ncbi:MAG TPA: hypothetical protein VMT87_10230 [Vicinamibacteria bacterium]|nr:hypothetical protein [Vicinamibacteria bacterium]
MTVAKAAGAVLLAVSAAACARPGETPVPADVAAARRAIEALRARVDERMAGEPHVRELLERNARSDVVVGLRSALVEDIVREVARRYLDRVELDLDLQREVEERREVEVSTPFGRVSAGEWRLHLVVHRVRGTLSSRTPEVRPARGNRLALRIPVRLEGAQGTATAHFVWDARALARVVCRDFEITRRVSGRVLADEYALEGEFELQAGPQALLVRPVFPRRRFRLRVDLAEHSWGIVRSALDEQDRILKCGLALEPDEILPKLRARLTEGFDIALPRSLFRAVDLPAGVRQSVSVEDTQVELTVRTDELRVADQAVWYAVSVRSRLRASSDAQ